MANYLLEVRGYGGEYVLGSISKEAYEYWSQRDDDDEALSYHVFSDPYEEEDGNEITDDDDPRFLGMFFEIDDIEHITAAEVESCVVEVSLDGEVVWSSNGDDLEFENVGSENVKDQPAGYYFSACSSEKGTFLRAEFEADDFDADKLSFHSFNMMGDELVSYIEYDGEDLEDDGGDTVGKGMFAELHEVKE